MIKTKDCTVDELKKRLGTDDAPILLDIRQPEEVAICRIEGSLHIPAGQIPLRLGELQNIADREIVVYCHHGVRSASVRNYLLQNGFDNVRNLAGGIDIYSVAADPGIPRY